MTLAFTKMQACGNDFVVVDDRAQALVGLEQALARRLCARHLGIGADGLLVLRPGLLPGHFGMLFVNADGLEGEMCGNGARCLAAYIRRAGWAGDELVLATASGAVPVRFLDDGRIELTLAPPRLRELGHRIEWQGRHWCFDALDVGPPHVVCLLDDLPSLEALDLRQLGPAVRRHPHYAPRGCNVNFAAVHQGRLHLRTYERGVEDETLGCGTGAVAAVAVLRQRLGEAAPSTVVTRSAEPLQIEFTAAAVRLTGGAQFIADGHCAPGLLQSLAA